jgi:hypothetical protein
MINEKNTENQPKAEFLLTVGLVVIGILTRLLFNAIHFYNFNAVIATAIFSGAYLTRNKWAMLVPFIALLATDAIGQFLIHSDTLGFYDVPQMSVVYGSFGLALLIGKLYAPKPSLLRYIGVTLGGSVTFFLVTNFALWPFYANQLYPQTLGGVLQSYMVALPFYRNTLLSDLIFTAVLFGGFEMAKVYLPQLKKELAVN